MKEDEQFPKSHPLHVNNDDIYSEVPSSNTLERMYQNDQFHLNSRLSNASHTDDDLSERYATVTEVNHTDK